MNQAIVYTSTHCHYCAQLKSYLKEQGIAFEERNIDQNEQYADQLWETGLRSVPVTVIGDTKILGLNKIQLNKAIVAAQS